MNTTNILLGTTSLLLVVAFAYSFGGLNNNNRDDEAERLRRELKAQIALEDREKEAFYQRQQRFAASSYTPAPIPPIPAAVQTPPPVTSTPQPVEPTPQPIDTEIVERLVDAEAEAARLEQEKLDLEAKLKLSQKETEEAQENRNRIKKEEEARAKKVRMALLMGTVTTAKKDHGLVIFQPNENANFQPGKVLNVRRNDGIIGQIEVDRLDGNLYVCSMREHGYSPDGIPDIQAGDEVIMDHGDR